MKKLIFTALSSLTMMGAFAQAPIHNSPETFQCGTIKGMIPKSSNGFGKTAATNYYEPYLWVGAADNSGNAIFPRNVSFLFPDSTVKYIKADGSVTFMPGATNFGQVLDPKDDNILLSSSPDIIMSKYNSYSLDSIYFTYLYVRNVDSVSNGVGGKNAVVDTLFIDYFVTSALPTSTINFTAPLVKEIYAAPNYDITNRKPTGQTLTQTILLTRKDSTTTGTGNSGDPESSWGLNTYQAKVPAGININSGRNQTQNYVGYNIRFKPGHNYYKGSDIVDSASIMVYQKDPSTLPAGSTRVNYFGYLYYSNGTTSPYPAQTAQTKFYTNSIIGGKAASYPNNPQGWAGYVPGNAFYAHQYLQTGLQLTSGNLGINEIKNDNFAMSNVFPNPAHIGEGAALAFNLKNSSNVTVEIFDLVGQLVKTIANKNFASGENSLYLDLAGMKTGVYFVNMNSNGSTVTKKLTITE